jgi:hypothetical protein
MFRGALQGLVLALELVDVLGPVDEQREQFRVGGLLVEVIGAAGDGLHGVGAVVVAGDHDDLGLRRQGQDLAERGQALGDAAGVRRQAEVQQHHAGLVTAQGRDGRLAVAGDDHLVAVKGPAQLALQALVVLDDQQRPDS